MSFVFFFFKQKTAYVMRISDWSSDVCSPDLFVTISDSEVPLADAIASYLFNSQLVCTADGAMRLIVAQESRDHAGVWRAIESKIGRASCRERVCQYV